MEVMWTNLNFNHSNPIFTSDFRCKADLQFYETFVFEAYPVLCNAFCGFLHFSTGTGSGCFAIYGNLPVDSILPCTSAGLPKLWMVWSP